MKKSIIFSVVLLLLFSSASYASNVNPVVKMTTSKGVILIELDKNKAPKTVDNFLMYINKGFYNGTIFHRVIKNFMIQGGGLNEMMMKKATEPPVINEADNGLLNSKGTIAMARTQDPHSATAQFFINVKDNAFLNHRGKNAKGWGYCVFGKVTQGMNVVHAIENERTGIKNGRRDVPLTPVVIESVSVLPGS